MERNEKNQAGATVIEVTAYRQGAQWCATEHLPSGTASTRQLHYSIRTRRDVLGMYAALTEQSHGEVEYRVGFAR